MNGTTGTEHGKLEQNRRKILGNTLAHTVQKCNYSICMDK